MAAKQKTIGVAVLGAGGRGIGCTRRILTESGGRVRVLSVFDPDRASCVKALEKWESPSTAISASPEAAIAAPGVDWVLVFSPNVYHKAHIIAGFEAGKHVFSEKPLATTLADCAAIAQAHRKSGRLFATGFVLRFSPIYRKAKEILDSGRLGRIISIDANENITPAHGGYIMQNWRRLTRLAGPHLLEKCCHDLDLINWYIGSVPTRVAGFGGLDLFVPKNRVLEKRYGRALFQTWPDHHRVGQSPFTTDKDILDNSVAILEYRNRVRVMFQATMSNAIPERRLYFSCTEGNLVLELYTSSLRYRSLGDEAETVFDFKTGGHGGGDQVIWKELFRSMERGTKPLCGGDEGLESAVAALAIDTSIRTGRLVNLEPIWKKLGR